MELIDNGFYADTMWIQCENEDCLKWRLLTIEDAASVDSSKPWYCHMNNDTWFNCCSVPEESYPEESVFHQCGLKLVYSQLPVGTLVLAKMSGWPSWPSILCPDCFTGEYVIYDKDGFVEQYHTEFLGKPHTRSWILMGYIEPYYTRGKLAIDYKRSRQWYKSAVEEAKMLKEFTSEERLKMCKLNKEALNRSYNRKSRNFMQDRSMARTKENLMRDHQQSNKWIRQSTSGKCKRKLQKATQDSSPIIHQNDTLASKTKDVLQAEDLLQDLEKMLQQINKMEKLASSVMSEKQVNSNKYGQKNKLFTSSVTVSEEMELKDSTGAEDCTIIDGIEFQTGECFEDISKQLKEIDVIMAELEGCL